MPMPTKSSERNISSASCGVMPIGLYVQSYFNLPGMMSGDPLLTPV